MSPSFETGYREQIRDLRLPPSTLTAWGVQIMDTDDLQRITAATPTGYTHTYLNENVIQWLDPQVGGITVILRGQQSSMSGLTRAPKPVGAFELLGKDYSVGQSPARNGRFPSTLSRHLGFRVLAHSDPMTVVQLPGTRDFHSAYADINGVSSDVAPVETQTGMPKGQDFLDIVRDGHWPYDMHFFDAHAPSLIIGGPEYAAALRGMVRHVNPDSQSWIVDWIGGQIDQYADIFHQGKTAAKRVGSYAQTGLVEDLHTNHNSPDSVFPDSISVIRRFNSVLAHHLSVDLPEGERPDVTIPL